MNAPAPGLQPSPGGRPLPPIGHGPVPVDRFSARRPMLACVGLLLLLVALAPGCSRPKTARYLGMEVRPAFDANGNAKPTFTDNAVVELDDGSRVLVACDMATARQIHPGTRVILVPQGQGWSVKPMADQKPATRPLAAP